MIHGATKIELYNPNTKIKNVVRSENTFQGSVIAQYMRDLGECRNTPYNANEFRTRKLWQNVVGGIFLFENAENVGNLYMSAGNRMIGNGSFGIANASTPAELGSFNSLESSASAAGITQVYDFTTNQGNGTIGCVCLTSQTGGLIGYGNESGTVCDTKYDFARHQSDGWVGMDLSNNAASEQLERVATIGNVLYTVINDHPNIKIRKTKVAGIVGSVFDGFYTETTFDKATIGNHLNWTTQGLRLSPDGRYIYIMPKVDKSLTSGNTGYFYKYDTQTDTLTEESFINSSNKTLLLSNSGGVKYNIAHGLIFATNEDSKVDVINLSTGVHVAELNIYARAGSFHNNIAHPLTTDLTLIYHGNGGDGVRNTHYIYDSATGACRPINTQFIGTDPEADSSGDYYDIYLNALCRNLNGRVYPYNNPLYLATINNLSSPVTKTAAQTMKVTYTLTEA